MSVTAEQAFEAREIGEPVMISAYHAANLLYGHHAGGRFFTGRDPVKPVDLADVLEWLGY